MRVRKEFGYALLSGIGVVSILGSIGAAWLYVNLEPILGDQQLETEMVRLQVAASLYNRRIETFQGVCMDIGIQHPYDCNERETDFAVSVEKSDGTFYCIDKSGFFDDKLIPIKDKYSCNPG